jgi:hypothetical protein
LIDKARKTNQIFKMEDLPAPKPATISGLLQERLIDCLEFFNIFEMIRLESLPFLDSFSTINICNSRKQSNSALRLQDKNSLEIVKTILGTKNPNLKSSIDPLISALKSENSKLVSQLKENDGFFSRQQLDKVKCQFNLALNSVFKLKVEKKKSEAEKYLDKARGINNDYQDEFAGDKKKTRKQSEDSVNEFLQAAGEMAEEQGEFDEIQEGEIDQHHDEDDEKFENLRRMVSGFSTMDNLVVNKNPTI